MFKNMYMFYDLQMYYIIILNFFLAFTLYMSS